MYRITKYFTPTYWRSIAEAFWTGVAEGVDDARKDR